MHFTDNSSKVQQWSLLSNWPNIFQRYIGLQRFPFLGFLDFSNVCWLFYCGAKLVSQKILWIESTSFSLEFWALRRKLAWLFLHNSKVQQMLLCIAKHSMSYLPSYFKSSFSKWANNLDFWIYLYFTHWFMYLIALHFWLIN